MFTCEQLSFKYDLAGNQKTQWIKNNCIDIFSTCNTNQKISSFNNSRNIQLVNLSSHLIGDSFYLSFATKKRKMQISSANDPLGKQVFLVIE